MTRRGITPAEAAKVRLKPKERLGLFTDLSTMLTAGIPILDAVDSLEADSKGNLKKVLMQVRASLDNGEPLSHAFGRLPRAFDAVSVNLVRAAEAGGTLEETLHDIVVAAKKEMAFSEQLRNTMVYPAFVSVIFFGIIILMLTFVIPRIAKVFSSLNVNMPLVTRVMIHASKFFTDHWLPIIAAFTLLLVAAGVLIAANKRAIVRLLLSLPLLNTLGTNIDLTRFTRSFGLLLHAGIPIVEALDLSERVIQKKALIAVVRQMKTDIRIGKPLGTSLRQNRGVVPPIMWRSIETAETTGTLPETFQNLTEYFDEQVNSRLKVLSSMLEPVLLLVVGILVGFLMVAIIAPIYNMISQISNIQK